MHTKIFIKVPLAKLKKGNKTYSLYQNGNSFDICLTDHKKKFWIRDLCPNQNLSLLFLQRIFHHDASAIHLQDLAEDFLVEIYGL